jgi:hypothetical protein
MSHSGKVEQLADLEPLADGPHPAPVMPGPSAGGLPAPAYNPVADKEYYRFLFAGVVMLLGCLMPFGPQWHLAGYKTLRGALFVIIALGIVWSSWASIHHRRMIKGLLRWVLLATLPLALSIADMMVAFRDGTAVADWIDRVGPESSIGSWGELFGELRNVLAPGDQVGEFVRYYGPGRLVVFAGAAAAELFMVMAIFGGARKISQQKAERRSSGSGGTRRRS